MNILRKINELVHEGWLAFSDEIVGLFDPDLDVEPDEDLEDILAAEQVRGPARRR